MPKTSSVKIRRTPGETKAEFKPKSRTVASGDLVFWVNEDEEARHKPQSINPEDNVWMDFPIPKKKPDQDAPTSNTVLFVNTEVAVKEFEYACELHPDETGTIRVTKQT